MSEQTSRFASSVTDTARENPIGAMLVGMGIAWLFAGGQAQRLVAQAPSAAGQAMSAGGALMGDMARSTGDAIGSGRGYASSAVRQAADVVGSAASRASEAVGSGMGQAVEQASGLADDFSDRMRSTRSRATDRAMDLAHSGRSQLGQMLQEQPLLLAAGAFAIGAAMAASLPLSETEERVLGEAAENAMGSGNSADSIGARLQRAADAGKEEARRQGLTPDALKADAAELRDRVAGAIGGVTGASSPPA